MEACMARENDEAPLRSFCEALLSGRAFVKDLAYNVNFGPSWTVPQHSHEDILQLDLSVNANGRVAIGERRLALKGVMAMAFLPGVEHAFSLPPQEDPSATIFSLKIQLPPGKLPAFALEGGGLKELVRNPPGYLALAAVLRRLRMLKLSKRDGSTLMAATAMELVALWAACGGELPSCGLDGAELGDGSYGLSKALALAEESLSDPPGVEKLAEAAGLSRRQLLRRFNEAFGMSPSEYCQARRLELAKAMLSYGGRSVTDAAKALGFPCIHSFSRWFAKLEGTPPSKFRGDPGLSPG